jgi:hypothetical protein
MEVSDEDADRATGVSESRPGEPVVPVLNNKTPKDGGGKMAKVAKSHFAQIAGKCPQGVHVMLNRSIAQPPFLAQVLEEARGLGMERVLWLMRSAPTLEACYDNLEHLLDRRSEFL